VSIGEGGFGPVLRRFRQAAGLTQEELAERSGLTAKAISALERGARRRPYPHTVRALAAALGLDEDARSVLVGAVPAAPRPAALPRPDAVPVTGTQLTPTTSIGRDHEVASLLELLERPEVRLVTITGPGGVGKTHLAWQVAATVAGVGSDLVSVVAMASLEDVNLALPTIAHALGLTATHGAPLVEALAAHIGDRRALLVLDNLEHIPAVGPDLVALVTRCASLTVLATSRAALRVRGEHDYVLAPLALPPEGSGLSDIAASTAVELFMDRAAAVAPALTLDATTAAPISAICRRLDGLPLGLEIVAAQLRYADVATVLARLDGVLEVPGPADLPLRQRSLRAVLQWSHDLLDAQGRVALRRLSVLLGTWTLEDGEAVAADEDLPPEQVLLAIGGLVEQSLVTVVHGPEMRYRMLEPVRRYALERLARAGEDGHVRDRHARRFAAFADRSAPTPFDDAALARHARLDAAQPNLAAALERLLDLDPAAAAHLCWSLWGMWMNRGHQVAGLELARRALDRAPDDQATAEAAFVTAAMEFVAGDAAAVEPLCIRAAEAARASGDAWVEAHARMSLGLMQLAQGRPDAARPFMVEAIALAEDAGDHGTADACRVYLAATELRQGQRDRAIRRLEDVLDTNDLRPDLPARALASLQLAFVALEDGDADGARSYVARATKDAAALLDQFILRACSVVLACLAATDGAPERAARLAGLAETFRTPSDAPLSSRIQHDETSVEATLSSVRETLGPDAFAGAVAAGAAVSAQLARDELLAEIG
jgi:predicted ATPase/DNA-binding XRE family transcriptional regulator